MGELRGQLPPGVPQPRRRDRAVQAADAARRSSGSSTCRSRTCATPRRPADGLELTEAARELIARQGYDPVYGARPLRRFIQREVETRIARALIAGAIAEGATITIDADGDSLAVRWRETGAPEPAPEAMEAAA